MPNDLFLYDNNKFWIDHLRISFIEVHNHFDWWVFIHNINPATIDSTIPIDHIQFHSI